MRILITGAGGQLGGVLTARLRHAGHDVVGTRRADLDITRHDAVAAMVAEVRPDVIVNCTAYNDVDGAEDDPVVALEVNALAVRSLARAARDYDAVLVHFSTDFVFEGESWRASPYTEGDSPRPQSFYGVSKLLGEWFAAGAPRHYVFRVESLFGGPAARSSLGKIVAALAAGRDAPVFVDRVVSPTYVVDVATALESALTRAVPFGLYHCVNGGAATWHEIGREIARLGGYDEGLLVPVRIAEVALKARRPQYCALCNGRLSAAGVRMAPWPDAVSRYLNDGAAFRS
jgi:dTDP-4-dehydrorhamnose reductase